MLSFTEHSKHTVGGLGGAGGAGGFLHNKHYFMKVKTQQAASQTHYNVSAKLRNVRAPHLRHLTVGGAHCHVKVDGGRANSEGERVGALLLGGR